MVKMKKLRLILAVSLALMCLPGCTVSKNSSDTDSGISSNFNRESTTLKPETTNAAEEAEKHYLIIKLQSKALAQNMLDENLEQNVYVYLPPSYYENDKKYPVVYFLHGFGDSPEGFLTSSKSIMDKTFKNGAKEFIMVAVNGENKTGGSFYVNSPVIGNWEDYVVNEVVALIDKNFKTINNSNSRGICGFSMGGFGAFNLALLHPDVFGSLLTMSPGLLAENELPSALETWNGDSSFKRAYAQAFSPNVNDTVNFGSVPELSGTDKDNAIVRNWENGFGNIKQKVDNYISLNKPLKSIKIIYGEFDNYEWIPNGCKYLSKLLDDKGIEHSIESFKDGHIIPSDASENYIIPFFNENLIY
jgi:S-formylglutathione hydrolase FrmB